jgi:hypothetical protein
VQCRGSLSFLCAISSSSLRPVSVPLSSCSFFFLHLTLLLDMSSSLPLASVYDTPSSSRLLSAYVRPCSYPDALPALALTSKANDRVANHLIAINTFSRSPSVSPLPDTPSSAERHCRTPQNLADPSRCLSIPNDQQKPKEERKKEISPVSSEGQERRKKGEKKERGWMEGRTNQTKTPRCPWPYQANRRRR